MCGRYEGFDERVHEHLATDVLSIGPYVLSGGELAAMVVCDSLLRKLPGALGHEQRALEESFSEALSGAPEYPHYTRPFDWRGHTVPEILISATARFATGVVRDWGSLAAASGPVDLRYHCRHARQPPGGSRLFYVRSHRKPRARAVATGSRLPSGRPSTRALPGGRGHASSYPGLRGRRDQATGQRRARDLHGAKAVVRRGGGAHLPAAFAEDRADRGRVPRRRAAREALLPARPRGPQRTRARAPLDRGRAGRQLRRGAMPEDDTARPGEEELAETVAAEAAEAEAAQAQRPTDAERAQSPVGRRGDEPEHRPPRSRRGSSTSRPGHRSPTWRHQGEEHSRSFSSWS